MKIKTLTLLLIALLYSGIAYGGQVLVTPIISSCTTVAAGTTDTTSPIAISGYNGYIGFSFTAVDANGTNFANTGAYLAYQVWDDNTTAYDQGASNTTPTLYGSNGYPATSAWQITGNTQSASNTTAMKKQIQASLSTYILWSIINSGATGVTVCTLNMVAQ